MTKRKRPGRGRAPPFLRLEKRILDSKQWSALSPKAVKMFIDIASQYNGSNNGDLSAPWSRMRAKGWRSKGTLHSALSELEKAGWIRKTRQGGKHRCNLYAVTINPIDECKGKHDARPTPTAPHDWKKIELPTRISGQCTRISGQSEISSSTDYPHIGPVRAISG